MSSARVPFILALFLLLVSPIIAGVLPVLSPVCDILNDTLSPIPGFSSTSPPPPEIVTTKISPQCIGKNNGTLVCCGQEVNGGTFPVAQLAEYCNYHLPKDTINGIINCVADQTPCQAPLCCQVITLLPLAALWCMSA